MAERSKHGMRMMAGLALAAAALLSACSSRAPDWAAADRPAAADLSFGPQAGYRWQEFDWVDGARERAVPVRLYLPRGAAPAGGWPLVLFSHGMGGSRRGYSYLGSYWAEQGFAVLHVQHVGSDRQVWSGNTLALVLRLQQAAKPKEAVARAQDLRFALDELLRSPLGAQVDARRIAVAGHSYGANTSLLLAGARPSEESLEEGRAGAATLSLADTRIRAAILISAPPFYGEGHPGPIVGGIRVPSLHISATEDEIRIPGYYSGPQDRLQLFEATGGPKALALFEGGSHSIFTDRLNSGGASLNPKVKQATKELSLGFLRLALDGQPQAWRESLAVHQGLLARWQGP